MNPKVDTRQGLHLPQPTPITSSNAVTSGQGSAPVPPAPHPVQDQASSYAYTAAIPGSMPGPQSAVPVSASRPTELQASPQQQLDTADDTATDTLDEEWISRAKDAVERYQTDPYGQSNELRRIKAEYLKVRYNKEIKIGKDPAQ